MHANARIHKEIRARPRTTGDAHSSSLLDLSMDLPLVIEFFDEPARVSGILEHLARMLEPDPVVWREHDLIKKVKKNL